VEEKKNRKGHEIDPKNFIPKHPPGEIWGVNDLKEKNANNKKAFRKACYREAILAILNDLSKKDPKANYSYNEMIPLIAEYFKNNNIPFKSNRKSIESAMKIMTKDDNIKHESKTEMKINGPYEVLAFRLFTSEEQLIRVFADLAKTVYQLWYPGSYPETA
jgi:hypothetical protein